MEGDGSGFPQERLERIHEILNRREHGGPVSFGRVCETLNADFFFDLAFEAGIDAQERQDTGAGDRRKKILGSLEKSFKQIERDLDKLEELDRPMSRQIVRDTFRPRHFRSTSTAFTHFALNWRRAIRAARASRQTPANRPKNAAIDRMLHCCADAAVEITDDPALTNSNSANSWFIKICHELIAPILGPHRATHQALYSRWREMKRKGARPISSRVAEGSDK